LALICINTVRPVRAADGQRCAGDDDEREQRGEEAVLGAFGEYLRNFDGIDGCCSGGAMIVPLKRRR
jgi:hypothetical protein